MPDANYLPRGFHLAARRFASGTPSLRDMALAVDPRYSFLYDDFIGDDLAANYPTPVTNGASAAVTVAAGSLTLTPGTDDNGYAGQGFGLHWTCDAGFYFAAFGMATSTIGSNKFEIGVTDAVDDAGAINAKATPTATASNGVVLIRDTDDNGEWDVLSVNADTPAADAEDVATINAATIWVVEMIGQNGKVQTRVGTADSLAGAFRTDLVATSTIAGSAALTPWVFHQQRANAGSDVFFVEGWLMVGPKA